MLEERAFRLTPFCLHPEILDVSHGTSFPFQLFVSMATNPVFFPLEVEIVGIRITSRMVIPHCRVSMNTITSATSLAAIRQPDSLASLSFSSGQSASSAQTTGAGETEPTRIPRLMTWRPTVCTKQLSAHLNDAYAGSHRRKLGSQGFVATMSPVRPPIMWGKTSWTFFITTLTLRFSIPSIAADVIARIGMQDVGLPRHLQDTRRKRRARLRVEQIDDQLHRRIAAFVYSVSVPGGSHLKKICPTY